MATFSAALREWKAKATTNDGGISCLQRRRASVDRLLESGLAVDANRLPVFLPAPVEGIALARALLRGAHGDRVPGLQRFLRRHAAVAVPVHVLRFHAGREPQPGLPPEAHVLDQQHEAPRRG